VLFELDLDAVLQRRVAEFKSVAKFQPVQRDIAVVVGDQVTHAALMQTVWDAPTGGLLRDAQLFDVYRPKLGRMRPLQRRSRPQPGGASPPGDRPRCRKRIDSGQCIVEQLTARVGARQRV
jgi:phenylalanyl-tRNA synthetase beta chain